MSALTDDGARTSPLWDQLDLSLISGLPGGVLKARDYCPEGMLVFRGIRAVGAGVTVKFRTASTWRQTLPGGTFDPVTRTVTRTFAENEAIEGVQITEILGDVSTGMVEVLP
jgi:hypothetical protein